MRRKTAAAMLGTALLAGLATLAWMRAPGRPPHITLSIIGTNDLHGGIAPDAWARGGLTVFGGYVENLRAARAADQGAVLLLDAGDTFQATTATMRGLESNLSEGAVVVDAYNALGYDALALGNHDFEFGSVDGTPNQAAEAHADLRGALKAAAARAKFPFLTANIHDAGTGRPLSWPNVRPSTIVEAAGIRVGLVGVMTFDGLSRTLVANVGGMVTVPLVPAITAEAERLRGQGADIVVLVAHAGGRCEKTADAYDLSTCDPRSEIFDVVRGLPRGTLQAIVAGHTHGSMAHVFEGVPITSVPEGGIQFGRTDLTIDTATRRVTGVRLFAPRNICLRENPATGDCQAEGNGVAARYEDRVVQTSGATEAAMAPGLAAVRALRARSLGITVDAAIERLGTPESPLGNLFADAIRDTAGVEVAISYGGGRGGLRAALPAGLLTFGALYDTFPFDNRVVRARITGAQLVQTLESQLTQRRRGLVSLSGLRGVLRCEGTQPRVTLMRESGERIGPKDELLVASTAYSASRIVWEPAAGDDGAAVIDTAPLVRDIVEQWLRRRGGRIGPGDFYDAARPRWSVPAEGFSCGA
jgi:2',3'-cyclic-nucleotide 2'-phosphodiesterase (5'-nucleotidase family)